MVDNRIDRKLADYVEREIIPRYDGFDKAHQRDHARMVIDQSLRIAAHMPELSADMVYCIAAFHDLGLVNGRERHHIDSGIILKADSFVRSRFSEKYGPEGYLRVWLPWSDNADRLRKLHTIIDNPGLLAEIFDRIFDRESDNA